MAELISKKRGPNDVILCPFVVATDSREQAPFSFLNIRADADQKNRPLVVQTVTRTLKTGDYSIVGHEDPNAGPAITIERKSIEDAIQTVILERDRFTRELTRMESFRYAAVVVEGTLAKCLAFIRSQERRFTAKAFSRGVISFDQQFKCKWHFCADRRFAEIFTFQLLSKFWEHRQRELKAAKKAGQAEKATATPKTTSIEIPPPQTQLWI
jgi:ERCC4-type nuclease